MGVLDRVVAFCRAVSSSLTEEASEPAYDVECVGGLAVGANGEVTVSDEAAEAATRQVGYGPLGVLSRPLPPEGDAFAEAIALRVDDGLMPMGWRDQRIAERVNAGGGTAPGAGQTMFAGYGGAFLTHAMTGAEVGSAKANITTLYVPHDFDGDGVPQKAHAINIDPTPGNSSISLVHASGVTFCLHEDAGGGPGISWAVDGQTFGKATPGEFVVNAAKIALKGNVYLGAQAEAGLPLLAGVASPPSPSVFVSPV